MDNTPCVIPPSMGWTCAPPPAAPAATIKGHRCSGVGWARSACGARVMVRVNCSWSRANKVAANPGCERQGVGLARSLRRIETHLVEVVGEAARPDDEHPLVGQRRQGLTEGIGLRTIETRGQGHLKHRHVGLGKQIGHGHPGAMIQPALRIAIGRPARRAQHLDGTRCQRRMAWGRVVQLIKKLRKSAKVVHRLGRLRGVHARFPGHPVGRHDQHRLRARQLLTQPGQRRAGECLDRRQTWVIRGRQTGRAGGTWGIPVGDGPRWPVPTVRRRLPGIDHAARSHR